MPRHYTLLLSVVAFAFATSLSQAALVWRPGEGWSDESGSEVSASSSRDQLELAHKLEAQGQKDSALKAYKGLLRRWPLSFFAPEAQFRVGKILEDTAEFYPAFQAFQKMVTKYPSSEYFDQALNEQYRIANLYLAGEPQRIWKIPVGPSMDRTIEMYQRIIKNAPYGTYAPQCQFNIGLAREKQRKYTDAVDSYQLVLDNYPASSVAANAQYQIGYAWMVSATTGDYDMGATKKAVDAFQDFIVRYPNSDKAPQAQENIQKLGQKQTQGAFDIAEFYQKSHPPQTRAAFIYYNEVVRENPNSAQAQIAKKRIQELRPLVEAMPGGLGPDGSGNPAVAAKTVSRGGAGGPSGDTTPSSGVPDTDPLPVPVDVSGPPKNSAPDATTGAQAVDPSLPVTSSSPGATAADGIPVAQPMRTSSTDAPTAQPVTPEPGKTPQK